MASVILDKHTWNERESERMDSAVNHPQARTGPRQPHTQALSDTGLEGDQGRALVLGKPTFPLGEKRPGNHCQRKQLAGTRQKEGWDG